MIHLLQLRLRWNSSLRPFLVLSPAFVGIVLVKDGTSAGQLPMGPTSPLTFYVPEQNVLSWGTSCVPNTTGGSAVPWRGTTKTMRKMQTGDKLLLVHRLGDNVGVFQNLMFGTVQFFCKT